MKNPFAAPKKSITSVADAIASLKQIVADLQLVSQLRSNQVAEGEDRIKDLKAQKERDQNEVDQADKQIAKMNEIFGV